MRFAKLLVAVGYCCALASAPAGDASGQPQGHQGQGLAAVTALEGNAVVIQGALCKPTVEGERIGAGAILETDSETKFLRLSLSDGITIDLGPSSSVMLWPPGLQGKGLPPPLLYVLKGWVKLSTTNRTTRALLSPGAELRALDGVAVFELQLPQTRLFIESGHAWLVERRNSHEGRTIPLKSEDFYWQAVPGTGSIQPRIDADMLAGLPLAFRDSLPRTSPVFVMRSAPPAKATKPSYALLEPWLDAPDSTLRAQLARRFAEFARNADFRRRLQQDLPAHPEWRPILFPPDPKLETTHTSNNTRHSP